MTETSKVFRQNITPTKDIAENRKSGEKISLKKLLSASVSLIHIAASAIAQIADGKRPFEVFEKAETPLPLGPRRKSSVEESNAACREKTGFCDPQTEADILSQMIISHSLGKTFRGLRIVAEEGSSNPTGLREVFYPPNLGLLDAESVADVQLEVSDLIVWIDPLDGTKQFIERSFDDVTILIGVSYKTKPVAGVIARPFTRHANGEPFVIWAVNRGAESAVKSNFGGFASLGEVTPPPRPTRTAVISFRAAASERYSAFLARARLTKTLKMGGCGRKVFALINGEADVYPFPVRGTKKWDTCAPQAILEALGGKFTMPDGAEFVYAENGVDNKEGFVATLGVDHCSFIEID